MISFLFHCFIRSMQSSESCGNCFWKTTASHHLVFIHWKCIVSSSKLVYYNSKMDCYNVHTLVSYLSTCKYLCASQLNPECCSLNSSTLLTCSKFINSPKIIIVLIGLDQTYQLKSTNFKGDLYHFLIKLGFWLLQIRQKSKTW